MKRDKILIIDDDPNILYAMRMVFEKPGYVVLDADGGQKGLQIISEANPDLVFLDDTMPDSGQCEGTTRELEFPLHTNIRQ